MSIFDKVPMEDQVKDLVEMARRHDEVRKEVAMLMAAYKADKKFSAFYVAGPDWYTAMAFVYDYGGSIASSSGGKWTGTLDQPPAIKGLTAFKDTFAFGIIIAVLMIRPQGLFTSQIAKKV